MHQARFAAAPPDLAQMAPIEVEVVIEVPRGSFLKRGSTGNIDFISPLPCPFNYGPVPTLLGPEGDLLDALVLGPRRSPMNSVPVTIPGALVGVTLRAGTGNGSNV